MKNLLLPFGRIAGLVGALLAVASGLARVAGLHWIAGYETITLLQGGVAGMVLGCFCLLMSMTCETAKC